MDEGCFGRRLCCDCPGRLDQAFSNHDCTDRVHVITILTSSLTVDNTAFGGFCSYFKDKDPRLVEACSDHCRSSFLTSPPGTLKAVPWRMPFGMERSLVMSFQLCKSVDDSAE